MLVFDGLAKVALLALASALLARSALLRLLGFEIVTAAVLVQTAGAAAAIAWPSRSLQDRLAATWVVAPVTLPAAVSSPANR